MLHLSGIPGIRGGIIRRVGNSNSAAFQRRLVTPCRPEPTARPPFWKRSTRRRQFSGANSWNTSQPIGYWNLPDCLPNLSCLPPKINNNKRPWSFPCSKVFHRPIKNLEHLPKRLAWLRLAWFRLAQVILGQVSLAQLMLGQVRLGQVRLAQLSLGQVRLGQLSLCQVRLGQVRLGQIRLGQRLPSKSFVFGTKKKEGPGPFPVPKCFIDQ